jgi:hypothetical protein
MKLLASEVLHAQQRTSSDQSIRQHKLASGMDLCC